MPSHETITPIEPALSLSVQPSLDELFRCLCASRSKAPLLIVCGAGVAMDAGFPSWDQLVRRLCEEISSDELKSAALADDTDNIRKVEYIRRLAGDDPNRHLLRRALYRDNPFSAPGRFGDAVARFAIATAEHRPVRIATTNFDLHLEHAIENRWGQGRSKPYGMDPRATRKWLALDTTRELGVLHLHGLLRPKEEDHSADLEPVVLGESEFRAFGATVQDLLVDLLKTHHALFLGVSLNDPNLVGPLSRAPKRATLRRFVAVTPDSLDSIDRKTTRTYFDARRAYLETELNVTSILLNSYAQAPQVLYELVHAKSGWRAYCDTSQTKSQRYGRRLRRIVASAYEEIGGEPDSHLLGGRRLAPASQQKVSDLLFTLLEPGGTVRSALDAAIERQVGTWEGDGTERLLGLTRSYLEQEHWGLFLWLRVLGPAGEKRQPYALRLVGCSTHTHRADWSQSPDIEIRPDTRYPVAAAVYYGGLKRVRIPDRFGDRWRSMLAVPLESRETDAAQCDLITVGGVSLNATRPYLQPDQMADLVNARATGRDVARFDEPSLLSLLSTADLRLLQRSITAGVLPLLGL